jgi:hypothetical protein
MSFFNGFLIFVIASSSFMPPGQVGGISMFLEFLKNSKKMLDKWGISGYTLSGVL